MKADTLKLRRCDECKKLFRDYDGAICCLSYRGYGSSDNIDLCKSCRRAAEENA